MMHSVKNQDELKEYLNTLKGDVEGYIQMSNNRIKHIIKTPQKLPSWDKLHNNNFIVEMALYEPKSKKSILIRVQNDKWLVLEKTLKDDESYDTFFTLDDNLKMKIVYIWQEESNDFCLGFASLEPQYTLFKGFEKGDPK